VSSGVGPSVDARSGVGAWSFMFGGYDSARPDRGMLGSGQT
jgi:hypothetical protein